MSIVTVVICIILIIGFLIATKNSNKDTDYLDWPGIFTMFLVIASFFIYDDKFESKKLELGFKDIYFIWIVFSPILIALLISIASPKINISKYKLYEISLNDRSMSSLDEAKKAEFKGEWQKAIGLYQDTLYYLKNDYKNLSKKGEKEKQAHVYICEESIRELANRK
jgi:multidrug transporter EmrE-like cation transporter